MAKKILFSILKTANVYTEEKSPLLSNFSEKVKACFPRFDSFVVPPFFDNQQATETKASLLYVKGSSLPSHKFALLGNNLSSSEEVDSL